MLYLLLSLYGICTNIFLSYYADCRLPFAINKSNFRLLCEIQLKFLLNNFFF